MVERFKLRLIVRRRMRKKILGGVMQHLDPEGYDFPEIYVRRRKGFHRRKFLTTKPALVFKLGKVDQQRIAGKRREAHVRGIPQPHRTERENLPQFLAGNNKPIDEMVRCGAEIP